jgi:TDG/mug DNA glycosylase family protein
VSPPAARRSVARPTKEQLAAAADRRVPDVLGPGLRVVFVGINPGLYSAATGHHFARPGNRFWKALHAGGFTPQVLSPDEDRDLPALGIGITNIVRRASAGAADLSADELRAGARSLSRTLGRVRPAFVAFLGLGAYRTAFDRPRATIGEQQERIGDARVWLLPNPSGLNAHHQLPELSERFADLARASGFVPPRR